MAKEPFQQRVLEWLTACFYPSACIDRKERVHRFLEEALELAQAAGCSREDVDRLADYVFARPVGRPELEVGGVMVTLAGLCAASGINMDAAADCELKRNWSRMTAIRHKQANRPIGSPLPQ